MVSVPSKGKQNQHRLYIFSELKLHLLANKFHGKECDPLFRRNFHFTEENIDQFSLQGGHI